MAVSGSATICLGAVLIAITFLLQSACVIFPVLGTLLGAACTLFTSVAAVILKRHAVLVYFGTGLVMLAVSPRYAAEFLMITGFVGLTLGLLINISPALSLLVSGIGMFSGLCCMTYLLSAAAFGSLLVILPAFACLPVFAAFSAAYPAIMRLILKRVMKKRVFIYRYQS